MHTKAAVPNQLGWSVPRARTTMIAQQIRRILSPAPQNVDKNVCRRDTRLYVNTGHLWMRTEMMGSRLVGGSALFFRWYMAQDTFSSSALSLVRHTQTPRTRLAQRRNRDALFWVVTQHGMLWPFFVVRSRFFFCCCSLYRSSFCYLFRLAVRLAVSFARRFHSLPVHEHQRIIVFHILCKLNYILIDLYVSHGIG